MITNDIEANGVYIEPVWEKQPDPVKNEHPAVWDLVLEDLKTAKNFQHPAQLDIFKLFLEDIKLRDVVGAKKYKTRLQPFNKRRSIQDAYEEILDSIVYTRSALYEETYNVVLVTEESEFYRIGLSSCYMSELDCALRLKFMIEKKKKGEVHGQSIIDTGNTGNS